MSVSFPWATPVGPTPNLMFCLPREGPLASIKSLTPTKTDRCIATSTQQRELSILTKETLLHKPRMQHPFRQHMKKQLALDELPWEERALNSSHFIYKMREMFDLPDMNAERNFINYKGTDPGQSVNKGDILGVPRIYVEQVLHMDISEDRPVWNSSLKIGDILVFPRLWYNHYGIYAGDGKVLHLGTSENSSAWFSSPSSSSGVLSGKAKIRLDDVEKVGDCVVYNMHDVELNFSPNSTELTDIVERCMSRLGEEGYHILTHNCEHFAVWCRYGKNLPSTEVKRVVASVFHFFAQLIETDAELKRALDLANSVTT